jgi:hypothetical protein
MCLLREALESMWRLRIIVMAIWACAGAQASELDGEKYVWIDGYEVETHSERTLDRAYDSLEGTSSRLVLGNACDKEINVGSSAIVIEISEISSRQTKSNYFFAKGKVAGYCRISKYNKDYGQFAWCAEMKRGQRGCAVDFTY